MGVWFKSHPNCLKPTKSTDEGSCQVSPAMALQDRQILLAGVGKSHKYVLGLGKSWLPRCGGLNKIKHNFITRGRPCGELRIHLQAGSPSRPVILMLPSPVPGKRQREDH